MHDNCMTVISNYGTQNKLIINYFVTHMTISNKLEYRQCKKKKKLLKC